MKKKKKLKLLKVILKKLAFDLKVANIEIERLRYEVWRLEELEKIRKTKNQ